MSDEAPRSCETCIFATPPGRASILTGGTLGKSTSDTMVCTKFSTILAMDADDHVDSEALERVASNCPEFAARTGSPQDATRAAIMQEPDYGGFGSAGRPLHIAHPTDVPAANPDMRPLGCTECVHHVDGGTYYDAGGEIPDAATDSPEDVGYCSARGTLLDLGMPGVVRGIAAECALATESPLALGDEGVHEHQANLLDNARPLRHLEATLAPAMGAAHRAPEPGPEPDPEVAPAGDLPPGAIAWEEFPNDDGTQVVRLPKFDPESFDEFERAKIPVNGCEGSPELYTDHANLAYRVAVAWNLGETPALHGPAGVGKTALFQYLAWRLGLPFERVSITASSSVDDLAGYMELRGQETVFELGRIPKAWAKPCVTVLDEPNAGPPEVWQFIRPMTDSAKQLVLDSNHGQVVTRHAHSYLGMAMNPAWDHRNTGVSSLADADGSRLLHIYIGYPSAKVERDIITAHCQDEGVKIDKAHLDALMEVAGKLRQLSTDGTLQVSWGIRQQVKVARLLPYVDFAEAYRLAAADSLEPQQQRLIIDEVNMATATLARGRSRGRARKAPSRSLMVDADGRTVARATGISWSVAPTTTRGTS